MVLDIINLNNLKYPDLLKENKKDLNQIEQKIQEIVISQKNLKSDYDKLLGKLYPIKLYGF